MNTKPDCGGPAFPTPMVNSPNDGVVPVTAFGEFGGITIRDYFAGKALTGLLAMCAGEGVVCGTYDDAAKVAYKHADAMMKARNE